MARSLQTKKQRDRMHARARQRMLGLRRHDECNIGAEWGDVEIAWSAGYVAALRDMRKKVAVELKFD